MSDLRKETEAYIRATQQLADESAFNNHDMTEFMTMIGREYSYKTMAIYTASYFFMGYHSRDDDVEYLTNALRHIAEWVFLTSEDPEDHLAAMQAFARDVLKEVDE